MDTKHFTDLTEPILNLQRTSSIDREIRERIKRGFYRELVPGVYYPRDAFTALSYHEQRFLLAFAAGLTSTRSVLAGRSAARMLGIWVIATTAEPIEMALTTSKAPRSRTKDERFSYSYANLAEPEVGVYRGVAVTREIRTAIDIARKHGFAEGLVAFDCLLARGIPRPEIADAIEVMGKAKGIATVRRAFEHAVVNSDSPFESYARALLIDANLTPITTQFPIRNYKADMCFGGWLLIEIDGRVKYEGPGGQKQMYRDQLRQREIENLGYVFRRYTPEFLLKHPDRFVAEIKTVIQARAKGPASA